MTATLWVEKNPSSQVWEPTYFGIWGYYSLNWTYYDYDSFTAEPGQEPTRDHPILACQFNPFVWTPDCPLSGFNPVVFLSASKHHPYLDAFGDVDDSPYSTWCGWWCDSGPFPFLACCDDVNGMGAKVLADIDNMGYPFGNNVGEPSRTKESCTQSAEIKWVDDCSISDHNQPLSERFCTTNHPPDIFVNLVGISSQQPGTPWARWENVWEDEMDFAGGLDRTPATAPPITCVLPPDLWADAATFWECLHLYLSGEYASYCEETYGAGKGGPRPPDWYRSFRDEDCGSGSTIRAQLKTRCEDF